jgi:hypothetical protein
MGQTELNIFVNADVYNSTECINDSRLGYHVTWEDNNNLNGYDTYSGVTSVTTWGGVYFAVSSGSSCYISPTTSTSIDASLYTLVKLGMRLDPGYHAVLPTKGQVQFQTSNEGTWTSDKTIEFSLTVDNTYREYLIDMSSHLKWSGSVTGIRFYPFIDGLPGIKIHFKYIKIESRSSFSCSSHLNGTICDQAYRYTHPCPWIGSPGSSKSISLEDGITIKEGVNDKLLVSIDGYGEQGITLRPVVGGTIRNIARDIQDKLNLIGVGGYAFARCYIEDSSIRIDSDWFDSSSSVVVTQPTVASACVSLGFFNSYGNKVATETNGTTSASRYERAPLQLNSSAVRRLKNSDPTITEKGAFSVDGTTYSPQGGNSTYREVVKDTKLTFRSKTLIDYDNPITSNGIITFVGYSGDAYSDTEFCVYRQKIDGSFTKIGSVDMSVATDTEDRIFESSTSIQVKKGDLLALYSAALHTGSSFEKDDFTYILVNYKLESGGSMWELSGSGNKGLPLFARGSRRNNEAILSIDFDNVELIESVYVTAEEEDVVEEVNLCTVRNGGLNGGPYVSGSTGEGSGGEPSREMKNLSALIDGDKQNINGISSYCYPSWLDLSVPERLAYDYTDFDITFDFAKGIDVYFPIYRIKSYFVDESNIKSFRWEVPVATNPEDTVRIWDTGWSSYNKVYTGLGLMDSSTIYLYDNPSTVTASGYQVSYSHLKYKYLELVLSEPFEARSLKFNATLSGANITKNWETDYAYFPIAPSPKIQEIEVFSKSVPQKNISESFYFESAQEDNEFMVHYDTDIISSTRARYTIGRPSSSLKLHISSDNVLKVFDVRGILSEDSIDFETNYNGVVALNPSKNKPETTIETIKITNNSLDTSNFYIDIFEDGSKNERCLLWTTMANDKAVAQSEIGAGGVVRKRTGLSLRPYNYAYKCPGYFLDKSFFMGKTAYVSRDDKSTWLDIGSVITDGSNSTSITNENALFHKYPYIYVSLDLGDNYSISNVTLNSGGNPGFASTILYSQKDTDDPSSIPSDPNNPDGWRSGSKSNARWVLFQAPAVNVGGPDIRYITYVEIDLDFYSSTNRGKSIWKSAGGYLTNGTAGLITSGNEEGWIKDGQSDYFCVNLTWWHNVTNVIIGPLGIAAQSINDTDALVPGVWPSIVNSDGSGSNVAYSKNSTDDPSEVIWGDFGAVPNNPVKWVLVRTDTRVEEIIVHVDSNVQNNKDSFLNKVWFTSAVNAVYNEYAHTKSGLCAIALDYPANAGSVGEYILLQQSLGIDREMAKRDALSFWVYISDVSQLDFTYGYFRLGRSVTQTNTPLDINLTPDNYNYFEWPLSEFENYLQSGWNYVRMPLTDNYMSGELFFSVDDVSRTGSSTQRDRMTNFKFAFRGKTSNQAFTVRVDDLSINRRYYTEARYDYGVYLPAGEYIKYPMNDFDPMKGTIEFFLKADWSKEVTCNSCQDPRDHTIVRVYSSESDTMFSLFMSGKGLKFYVTDGENPSMVTDNTSSIVPANTATHIAMVWDFTEEYDAPTMGIYINGVFTVGIDYEDVESYGVTRPSFVQSSYYTLMVGGLSWTGLVSYDSSSVDGAIENLKVFNYPITDFSYVLNNRTFPSALRASELVKLSLDGVNFYGIEDSGNGLPLFKQNVAVNEFFNVYVTSRDLDKTKKGEKNRRANISVARTPA